MDNPRVEEGESAENSTPANAVPPRPRAYCTAQLQQKLLHLVATVVILFLFTLLIRVILPGDSAAQAAVAKTLTQQVAALLPIHENPLASTTPCCNHTNGSATAED
jgi:hypothetical protein